MPSSSVGVSKHILRGSYSECFRFVGHYCLCYNYSVTVMQKQLEILWKQMGYLCSNKTFFTQTGGLSVGCKLLTPGLECCSHLHGCSWVPGTSVFQLSEKGKGSEIAHA